MHTSLRKLPDFTQLDLFTAEYSDIAPRMLQDLMWRPFFALGKSPRSKPIIYKNDNVQIKISGIAEYGIATIWDADILTYITSLIVEARDKGEPTSPQVYFTPYDCLKGTRRDTGGSQYERVVNAIKRLTGTLIETNIRQPDQISLSKTEQKRLEVGFHWLEAYGVQHVKHNGKEAVKGITAVVPNWLYRAVINPRNILTINEDYFLITSGLNRMLYLIARKHVGRQKYYSASMRELYEKTGSEQRFSDFTRDVRRHVEANTLPEYYMMLSPKGCKTHRPRHSMELEPHHVELEVVTFWNQEWLAQEPLQLKLM